MKLVIFLALFFTIGNSYCQDTTKNNLHSPKKSAILSLCLPSAGQFYNHASRLNKKKNNLWWKIPIIYGGLGTSVFFLLDNNKEYNVIKNERLLRLNTGQINAYPLYTSSQLKIIQNDYRRWRDLSVISIIAVYLLQVIDASVEGHLIHFDNSDNLSLNIKPLNNYNNFNNMQLSILYRF